MGIPDAGVARAAHPSADDAAAPTDAGSQPAAQSSPVVLRGRLGWGIVVAGIAVLVRFPLLFDRFDAATAPPDAATYLALADQIQHGPGLWHAAAGISRTPGYPLLILALDVLPGRREDAIMVAQHLVGVALAVAVLLIAWRFFGRAPAALSSLLVALSTQLIAVENDVLTDFLFGVAVFLGAVALAE